MRPLLLPVDAFHQPLPARSITASRPERHAAVNMGQVKLTAGGKQCKVGEGSSMLAACKKLGIQVRKANTRPRRLNRYAPYSSPVFVSLLFDFLQVPTSCKKGNCGTCTVKVGGKPVKACIGKVPVAPKLKSIQEKGLPVSR